MVNLYVSNDDLAGMRAETLISQAQGDYEQQSSSVAAGHQAIRDAHADYASQRAALFDNALPPSSPSPASAPSPPDAGASGSTGQRFSPYDDVFKKYAGPLANNPEFISIVAAGTKAESSWNAANTTGDGGHSWGLYQMHDQGAGAGMGASRLDPEAASAKMVPLYAAAYQAAKTQNPNLSGPALAAQVAQAAERSADPTGAAYARAYREISGGDTGGQVMAQTAPSNQLEAIGSTVQGAGQAVSNAVSGAVSGAKDTAASLIAKANDEFQSALANFGKPSQPGSPIQGDYTSLLPGGTQNPIQAGGQAAGDAGLALSSQGLLARAMDPNVSDDELAQRAIMALSAGKGGESTGLPLPPRPIAGQLVSEAQPEGAVGFPNRGEQIASREARDQAIQAAQRGFGLDPDEVTPAGGVLRPATAEDQARIQRQLDQQTAAQYPGIFGEASPFTPRQAQQADIASATGLPVGSGQPPSGPPPELSAAQGAPEPQPTGPSAGQLAWGLMAEGKKSIFSLSNVHAMNIARGLATSPAGPQGALEFAGEYLSGLATGARQSPKVAQSIEEATADGVNFFMHSPETGGAAAGINPWLIRGAQAAGGGITSAASVGEISKTAGASDEDALRNAVVAGAIGAIAGPTASMRIHDVLWQDAVPLAKVLTWQAAKNAGYAGEEAAKFSNNLNGGQGLAQVAGSRPMTDIARLLIQSPDWMLSQLKLARDAAIGTAKSVPGVENLPGMGGKMTGSQELSRDWLWKTALVYGFATEAIQYGLTGHFTDQNSPGREFMVEVPSTSQSGKPGNITASLFDSNVQQVLDAAAKRDPGSTVGGKLNPWVTTPVEEMTNRQWLSENARPITTKGADPLTQRAEQAQFALGRFAPVGISQPVQEYYAGAPLPVIAASALSGIPMNRNAGAPPPQRAILPRLGAEPDLWSRLRAVFSGAPAPQSPGRLPSLPSLPRR